MKTKIVVIILIFVFLILAFYFYFKSSQKDKITEIKKDEIIENTFTSNIIENVEYLSKDARGNEYIIRAKEGEIDEKNDSIIFLKNVSAIIRLTIQKLFQFMVIMEKYNIKNLDTIFSKNVIINYLNKK